MIIILLILFTIMLIGTYFLFKKDIIEPVIIFVAAYVLSIFCATININKWNVKLSIETFLIILLGAIEFIVFSYIVYYLFKKKCKKVAKVRNDNNYNISKIITIILIIYDIIALILLIYNVLSIAGTFGEYNSFSNALQLYKQHTSYSKDAELPNYVTIMIKPIIATAYIYMFIYLKKFIYNNEKNIFKKALKNSYYLIPALIYIIQRFSESNRGSIINFALSTVVMAILIYNMKNEWKVSLKITSLIKLCATAALALVVFYFSAQIVGRVNTKNIVDYITCYCGGSIECFNLYVKNDYKEPDYSGNQTFGRTIRDLNKLKIMQTEVKDTDTQPFKYYQDNMIGNVYTSYQRWLQDYGIVGIIILQCILAIIFNVFYNIIKYCNLSTRIKEYLIIIYTYLIYTIFMHPIDSLFYLETFTIATAGVFLMITFIYFLITSDKVNNLLKKITKTEEKEKNIENNKKEIIKILCITPGLNVCGGIESYCMNYYRNISSNIKMDFATHEVKDNTYVDEINENGGKIYILSPINLKNLIKNIKEIKDLFKNHNDYDVVHCNMANAAIFYFYYAKKYGIKIRIIHSHQNNYADKILHKVRNIPLIKLGNLYATHRFACSKLAGDFLFGNKNYYIIKNSINIEKYEFDENKRNIIRKQLGIEEAFVIGTIGRLTEQKNQIKLIEIAKELILNMKKDIKIIIIGEGHLEEKLKEKVQEYNLKDKVIFTGSVNNVEYYLQAMDCFVLTSLYEGLGIVNIEAQAAGLPTIVSDKVPQEAKVTDLIKYINLDSSSEIWAKEILETGKNKNRAKYKYTQEIRKFGYDIKLESKKLENLYFELVNKSEES